MENNERFSEDLNVEYLNLLAKYNYSTEFGKYYEASAAKLADRVDATTDVEDLGKLKNIVEFKRQLTKEGMSK